MPYISDGHFIMERIVTSNLQSSLVPRLPVTISQTMTHSTASETAGDTAQNSSLLTSEFCELTSKLDRDNLIKVELAQPCRYLEEVPIFGIGAADEVQQGGLSNDNVDLSERMSVLETTGLDPSHIETRPEGNAGIQTNVESDGEPKESKVDLLNSAPFLVSEDGVVFQCFPISEKEVIIVSLNDNSLATTDSLPSCVPIASESNSGGNTSHLRICPPNNISAENKIDIGKKLNISLTHPVDGTVPGVSSQDNTESSVVLSSVEHEGNYNTPSCTMAESSTSIKKCASNHIKPGAEVFTSSVCCGAVKDTQSNATINHKRKLNCIVEDAEEGPRKEAKITHATVYAPLLRKPRSLAADSEEQMSSEWLKCSMCSNVLPSAATLRHHLVVQHQQKNITSFLCFLCKHECWSENQQDWHLRVHHGIKNKAVACFVCGARLSTPAERKAHVRKHPATLACPSCSLKFSAQHQLAAHAKQHLEKLQPHGCLICGARFTQQGVLQVHLWRHRPQKCPQEECEHVAEDESWLVIHLQNEHALTSRQIHCIITDRNASDHKMDLLLGKYSSLQDNTLASHSSHSLQEYLSFDNMWLSSVGGSSSQLNHAKSEKLKSCSDKNSQDTADQDLNILKNVVNCLVEAVANVEEEEKKGTRREEDLLYKVTEEGPTLHRCGLCNIYLPSAEELALHKAGHDQAIICLKCQKSFLSMKQLKRHMTVHNSQDASQLETEKVPREHRCLQCGKICGSESALSRHRGTHMRSLGRHQCETCKRQVRTRAHLIEHMARVHKINHESKKLQCPMCDRRFTTKTHLESHLIIHGEREPQWSCNRCGRSYVRPSSLQRHMATHDQKYVCSTCDESFVAARHLAIHARKHDPTHKTRLSCPKCPQRYAYESQFQVHMRIHTGEKPYVCETCGKCFKRLQQCRAHHRSSHENHKETCVQCYKTFGDKTNLLRHRLMVHNHLKRWVCGVCAQSYAYSQDLRKHLQKKHNLTFEKLDRTNKKSRHEVYVVPELGSQNSSAVVQGAVEIVCALEHRKVQQVLCGTSSTLKKPRKHDVENAEEVDNPDDPSSFQDNPVAFASLVVNEPPPVQETAVTAASVLVPSATIAIPTLIENNHIQAEEKSGLNVVATAAAAGEREVQSFVRLAGITCVECGVETSTPLQCGPCGALLCSQGHLDIHVASNHHVMFQCSVCGLHYASQGECVAHVTSSHSSHLLAVQGGATTYLTPQSSQSIQIASGSTLPPQICLPLPHSQPTPQCLMQVGGRSSQVPLVIAPARANTAIQQIGTSNVILQYPNVTSLPSSFQGIPHSATLDSTKSQGNQPVFTMTGVLSGQQATQPRNQRKANQNLDKQKQAVPSVCAITLPSSNDGGLILTAAGETPSVNLSSVQNIASLPTVFPHTNNSGENSTFLMGNLTINSQPNDGAPVLLMGSLPFNNLSVGSTTVLSQNKQCNVSSQTNTSVASVLLTLAEASASEVPSSLALRNSPRDAEERLKYHPAMTVTKMPPQKTCEEVPNIVDGPNLLQSLVGLPVENEIHTSDPPLLHTAQEAENICSQEPPQEVSVQIIQPRRRKSKAESKTKLFWEKEASRTQRDEENKMSSNSATNPAYQCPTCGKELQSKTYLERHQRTHATQKFKCQECDKAFTEKYNLKIHMLTHTHERPHVCSLCLKSFRFGSKYFPTYLLL
nr:uncharacterized protein LOC128691710 [Cherax quadricarinatus]XP_053636566.1 uncharacterized protein LOC128691710 [Cherax quadricarinatus]